MTYEEIKRFFWSVVEKNSDIISHEDYSDSLIKDLYDFLKFGDEVSSRFFFFIDHKGTNIFYTINKDGISIDKISLGIWENQKFSTLEQRNQTHKRAIEFFQQLVNPFDTKIKLQKALSETTQKTQKKKKRM